MGIGIFKVINNLEISTKCELALIENLTITLDIYYSLEIKI